MVATTTIAQGLNFPVTGVVMASHQYPMARICRQRSPGIRQNAQGARIRPGTGIVALAATDDEKAEVLSEYVRRNVSHLNSYAGGHGAGVL